MHIAVLGSGTLGRPIAERLHRQGHHVTVYNRTGHKTKRLAALGLSTAPSAPAAIQSSQHVLLLLADAEAIRAVLANQSAHLLEGRTVIQMGTISPAQSMALEQKIAAEGGEYCEAPVLGSVTEAESGMLLILFGGTQEQLARCDTVFRALSPDPYYVGPVGKAAALKLALNQLIAAETAAFALSLALVQREGVDVDVFMAVLRKSALYAPTFDKKLTRLLSRDYRSPNFSVRHLIKDVRLFLERARCHGLVASSLQGVLSLLANAAARGLEEADYSALFEAVNPPSQQNR